MDYFNGGTIALFIFIVVVVYGLVYFAKNKDRILRRDNSPLELAKREWCKAWDGTVEKERAEKEWDELGIAELNKATTLSELCSTCERVFWYSHHGKYKKRESEVLLEIYKKRKKELRDKKQEEDELHAEEFRKNKGKHRSPPLKKIGKDERDDGNIPFLSLVKKETRK